MQNKFVTVEAAAVLRKKTFCSVSSGLYALEEWIQFSVGTVYFITFQLQDCASRLCGYR
jgi:hypothetical protein